MERENLLELSESDLWCFLENVIELLCLLVVRDETNHLKNGIETFPVQLLLVGSFNTLELKDLTEVLVFHIVHACSA